MNPAADMFHINKMTPFLSISRHHFDRPFLDGIEFSRKTHHSHLFCAEQPVAGVADTGHDVAVFIEPFVDAGGIDRHVGMGFLEGGQSKIRAGQRTPCPWAPLAWP